MNLRPFLNTGRIEAKLTLSQRSVHVGRWVPWHKMVQGDGGFKRTKMGELLTCCLVTDKAAPPCGPPATLSDLHTACSKCGEQFYTFELPAKCRHHTGLLEWRGPGAAVYRWACCDRLSHEQGCNEFFQHLA